MNDRNDQTTGEITDKNALVGDILGNLDRSLELAAFLSNHLDGWDHEAWLGFKDLVRRHHGIVDDAELGAWLEEKKHRYSEIRQTEITRFLGEHGNGWDHTAWLKLKEFVRCRFPYEENDRLLGTLLEREHERYQAIRRIHEAGVHLLLAGVTGTGKSSTVNALLGKEVAKVSHFEPGTFEVKAYSGNVDGIDFTVYDTPGLCDSLPETGKDREYIELMKSNIESVDAFWFVSRISDIRLGAEVQRAVELLTEAFGRSIWGRSIIVVTFAGTLGGKIDPVKYIEQRDKSEQGLRKLIKEHAKVDTKNIPFVCVDNGSEEKVTPDGKKWLGHLFTSTFLQMSEKGKLPYLMGMATSLLPPAEAIKSVAAKDLLTASNPALAPALVPALAAEASQLDGRKIGATPPEVSPGTPRIELTTQQIERISSTINADIIPKLASIGFLAGAAAGSWTGPGTALVGAFGAAVGATIGAGLGLVAWLLRK
jgi:hypothetical protein